ncbi:nicotinamide-nucleotide amidohydrolase family protein [Altererythrobacter aurantiacus]|uniref:Nicotinamide-nucleotide amidohydrolase family protein n=1 Tax=Parapontixanthobacter aurantiacus TaxID=1463599 RepID=A0A844ZD69_9SPHN|nr:CinA family protein [Parapontixanthobacter aurantiacus]MXO85718.1 nicotinamide-nucleotide amidohydrolase family protein [Parapontixanthobacter aurantiacus]
MAEELEPALPRDVVLLAEKVLARAKKRDVMLATAESCTGGLLAALLTDVPGYSHVFDRGFVSYSDDAKCDLLGIEREMVDSCGAVSAKVAEAMAQGALDRSAASLVVSITGFAGPGDDDDEEGLVHFACAAEDRDTIQREEHFGAIGRDGVRLAALRVALDLFKEGLA